MSLQSVQLVDYEDDLDLFVVTAAHQEEDILKGTIYLHNNETGEILKKVTLNEPWLEVCKIIYNCDLYKMTIRFHECSNCCIFFWFLLVL